MLYFLIFDGAVFRFANCLIENPLSTLDSDSGRHWDNALHLFTPNMMGGMDPLLYQVFIWLIQQITGSDPILVGILMGLMSVLMPWLYFRAAQSWGMEQTRALLLYAALSWTPSFIFIYHFFMTENLLLLLIGGALWSSARCLQSPSSGRYAGMTLLWALACLTKPTALVLAGIIFLYVWCKSGRRWRWLWVSAIVFALAMVPNTIRTQKVLGFPAPLGGGIWLNSIQFHSHQERIHILWDGQVWLYASPSNYYRILYPWSDWRIKRSSTNSAVEVVASRSTGVDDWKKAYDALPHGWKQWKREYLENTILFFFAPSWPDSNMDAGTGLLNFYFRLMWPPIILFVLWGNLCQFRKKQFHPIALATMGLTLFLLLQNSVLFEGRYKKPLEPLLIWNMLLLFKTGWAMRLAQWRERAQITWCGLPANVQSGIKIMGLAAGPLIAACFCRNFGFLVDEGDNMSQIQRFMVGNSTWTPSLATGPGYHAIMAVLLTFFNGEQVWTARLVSLVVASLSIPVFYRIAYRHIDPKTAYLRTLQFAFLPLAFVLLPILYTDIWALLFFLLAFEASLSSRFWRCAFWLTVGALIRQTDILWGIFILLVMVTERPWPLDVPAAWRKLRAGWPVLIPFALFGLFVWLNGSVALGDKKFHYLAFNITGLYMYLLTGFFFFLPLCFEAYLDTPWRITRRGLAITGALFAIYYFTYANHHPYNQEQQWLFLRNRVLFIAGYSGLIKALAFLPLVGFVLLMRKLRFYEERYKWWYAVSLLTMPLFPLVECRYYLVSFTLLLLLRRQERPEVEWTLVLQNVILSVACVWAMTRYQYFF